MCPDVVWWSGEHESINVKFIGHGTNRDVFAGDCRWGQVVCKLQPGEYDTIATTVPLLNNKNMVDLCVP